MAPSGPLIPRSARLALAEDCEKPQQPNERSRILVMCQFGIKCYGGSGLGGSGEEGVERDLVDSLRNERHFTARQVNCDPPTNFPGNPGV